MAINWKDLIAETIPVFAAVRANLFSFYFNEADHDHLRGANGMPDGCLVSGKVGFQACRGRRIISLLCLVR